MLLVVPGPAAAVPFQLTCPAKYPVLAQVQTLQADGWRAPFPGIPGAPLEQASVSLGPPEENGELKGTPLRSGAGERFILQGFGDGLEKWAFCGYRSPTGDVRLMHKIPVNALACETRVRRERGGLVGASVRCE